MDTKKFRTRQEFNMLSLPKGKDYIVALDVGYSGTKVFYETGYACFPSYAKLLDDHMMNVPDHKDIVYRNDETGDTYLVGYNAQNMADGSNDTDSELYSRKRYTDPRFRIICYTAIGIAAMKKTDDRKIIIQTGLPASYLNDAVSLRKAITEMPRFSLKIGAQKEWISFDIKIDSGNIFVMPQPMGALYSTIIYNNGSFTKDAMSMLKGSVMVLDAGFGTFDFYGIKDRHVDCQDSIDDISMRQVFIKTTQNILNEFGEEIRVPALQKNLSTGYVTCIDEEDMGSCDKDFSNLLERANNEVFEAAKVKIRSATNAFRGYQYVIVDGGTGEAWFEKICDWLSNMKTLQILPSNINDKLPFIYSNARGYYMFRYTNNKK